MLTTERRALDDVVEMLAERGYTLGGKLGEGCTREVYQVTYNSGSLSKSRVAKIPKADPQSVTARINLSKGNLDEREVMILNKVRHPNIVEIYDAFGAGNRTITIEEHFNAISLEDLVRMNQPIADPTRFRNIFLQAVKGLEHLHKTERIYHRDIKPSNILVGRDGTVKLSDLQNAAKIDEMQDSSLPTRGGTPFTHPDLLNALMNGELSRATLQTEFYALGATMYYALTGKNLIDISLEEASDGKAIDLGDTGTIGVALKSDGKRVAAIDKAENERRIKTALRAIAKPYRKMLARCLIGDGKNYTQSYNPHELLEHDLQDATRPSRFIDWGKVRRRAQAYLITASVIGGVIAGCQGIRMLDRIEKLKEPSVTAMLEQSSFADATYAALMEEQDGYSRDKLMSAFEDLKKGVKGIGDLDGSINVTSEMHNVSKRLSYSLMRAAMMENHESVQLMYGRSRLEGSLVPRSFMRENFSEDDLDKVVKDLQVVNAGVRYMKRCVSANSLGNGKPALADVFASYFCEPWEIFKARKDADAMGYFSSETWDGKKKGYGWYLPEREQKLVDRAVALYALTDNEGFLHLDRLDSSSSPIKGLEAK